MFDHMVREYELGFYLHLTVNDGMLALTRKLVFIFQNLILWDP